MAEPCGINETEKDKICYKFYCIDSVIVYNLEFLDRVFSIAKSVEQKIVSLLQTSKPFCKLFIIINPSYEDYILKDLPTLSGIDDKENFLIEL